MNVLNIKFLSSWAAILTVALALAVGVPASTLAADPELVSQSDSADSNVQSESADSNVVAQASKDEEDINDPLETLNRFIFDFNEFLQDAILRPVSQFYNETFPVTFRRGLSNFLDNLSTPVILANDILQGEFQRALETFGRAFINTTIGMLGIADVAGELGVERHKEDFGQTLAVYGVGEGFYLVLPIFGPSNPRDTIGKFLVDPYLDPLGLWLDNTNRDNIKYTLSGVRGVDEYAGIVEELNQVKKTSVDYYAAISSLYRQKRKTEINNGSILDLPPIPELGYDMVPEDLDQPLAGVNHPSPN